MAKSIPNNDLKRTDSQTKQTDPDRYKFSNGGTSLSDALKANGGHLFFGNADVLRNKSW